MASYPQRAWNNKLANIDAIISWMYEKDILNKGEKAKKDSIFCQYYRYYNDGDIPRGMKYRSRVVIEAHIEKQLEEFIKKILTKYKGKYSRKQFRQDQFVEKTYNLIQIAKNKSYHALTKYWVKDVKNPNIVKMIKKLEYIYDAVDKVTNDYCKEETDLDISNMTMSYRIDKLLEENDSLPSDLQMMIELLEKMMEEIRIELKIEINTKYGNFKAA